MSTAGQISSVLAALPSWLQSTTDTNALDNLLTEWVRLSGFRSAGVIWPWEDSLTISKVASHGRVSSTSLPTELPDVVRRLKQGEPTAAATALSGNLRVYAPIKPQSHRPGVFWAERPYGVTTSDLDKQVIALTAKLIEHSPALHAIIGPSIDSERLMQRLQDAAVIAGRMAHDFDNVLTGIIGFADLSAPQVPPGSNAARFINEIGKVGQRGIQFTQQLHQLSRSGQAKPNPSQLSTAVAKEESRLRPLMGAQVRLLKELPPNLPPVAVESLPLQVVIGHLLENAIEAVGESGTVVITAKVVELTDTEVRGFLGNAKAGANLEISITDSGPGISPTVRQRLFAEPFFTTKVRHRGLGLAIVFRTLYSHHGGIRLESPPAPATGTIARIILPLAPTRIPVVVPITTSTVSLGG